VLVEIAKRVGVFGLLLVVVGLFAGCAETPLAIRDEIATTARVQPGATTVVFFTDFQCPFCRRTHAALQPLLEQRPGKVRLVIRHVPLPRHPDARSAARAAVCFETITAAPRLHSENVAPDATRTTVLFQEYVHALMTSPDLSEAACERIAEEHGVSRDAMQRGLSDSATDARLEKDLLLFDMVHGDGVPLLFIGKTRLEGAQSRSSLEAALEAAGAE
jgi:protein-disulfide isomerase